MTRLNFVPLLIIAIMLLVPPGVLVAAEPEKAVDTQKVDVKKEDNKKLSIIEMVQLSILLPRNLIDLQNNVANMNDIAQLDNQLPDYAKEINELKWEVTIAESTPDIGYHQLALLESKLAKLKLRIDAVNTPISRDIRMLQAWYTEWLEKEREFDHYKDTVGMVVNADDIAETIKSVVKSISAAKKLIEVKLVPLLQAARRVGEIQTQVHALDEKIADLIRDTNELRVQQTSPSMLNLEFYKRLDFHQLKQSFDSLRLFALYQWDYLKQNFGWLVIAFCCFGIFTFFIRFSRTLVPASSRWHDYASKPFLSALFISAVTFSTINIISIHLTLPPDWDTLIQLPLIIAVAYMTDIVVPVRWQAVFLRRLSLFLAITTLLMVINIPHPVFYFFVFYSSVLIFIVSLHKFIRRWKSNEKKKVTWAIWLWGLFPLVIITAGIGGYDQLAILLFGRVLVLIVMTLVIWVMLQVVSGLLELILLYFPMDIVRNNASTIVRQVMPMIAIFHGVLWLATALTVVWVYPTVLEAFDAVTSLKFKMASFDITPGSVLVIVFGFYVIRLFSRGLRAFLMQEVLPRYRVEKGVQVSITRLVHYAVLTIGLLILLRILGFSLSQITILGGALSVGIGFGLQAIVNNFVSGLILLFERPIKVGDMIEVGSDVGEVKELGLRATTVQTFDNAEIVIPNSELITGSVINWTLAEKKARVKIPVGVAYGSDITKVMEILLSCAHANPLVLSTPKPTALFLAFGASSLDFEVRVWIADVNFRLDVLSELNQDIESEFQLAGIEIPFPQTDLHVRSVDSSISDTFLRNVATPETK